VWVCVGVCEGACAVAEVRNAKAKAVTTL